MPLNAWCFLFAAGTAALAACGDGADPGGPLTLALAPVDSGFDFSVFVTAPPGDTNRLVIVERGGRILLRKNGVRQDSAFLNLTHKTDPSTGEYGTYSLAFHPNYASNHRLFVYYVDLNGDSRLSEFTSDPSFDLADPASEQVLLTVPQDTANLLYGGTIAFGPDGMLYLALGDTLTGDRTLALPSSPAQDSASLMGKMLRLNVSQSGSYTIPGDNPFVNRPGWQPEIWALGFRNPWRWSFDRATGQILIGDVGEHNLEEIDRQPAGTGGRNYGWPIREGPACYRPANGCSTTGLEPPLLTYSHLSGCSVTGGYVYRGRRFPRLRGTYFYGDYCSGWVRSGRVTASGLVPELNEVQSPIPNDNLVSFGEDAAGEVYVVMASGRVYRISEQ